MMNERIQELWNKAAESTAAFPSGQNNSWETQVNFMDKFAELIVRECMEVCKSRVGNSDYNTGRMHCVSDLKEHFGVEN